jgi:hypothetical protein
MNSENSKMYQTYLKGCGCEGGGIIIFNEKPVCRWCRTPYGKGGGMSYYPEHFGQSIPAHPNQKFLNMLHMERMNKPKVMIQILNRYGEWKPVFLGYGKSNLYKTDGIATRAMICATGATKEDIKQLIEDGYLRIVTCN